MGNGNMGIGSMRNGCVKNECIGIGSVNGDWEYEKMGEWD